ncbi:Calsyntenin-2 Alcadein-gamma [Takifugu flavidus]|uniref:Calsyntenin-2 Alcadein-gamma n=1 Tax=Takifugu flavidus TaxID=433684 RepID=A0A5C6P0R3_9TELE|nr:Calsyntenin-2 Alcadein-gamma [Takifugu flavidus]
MNNVFPRGSLALCDLVYSTLINKHKPWIETSYHGVITENMDTVLLDPPLVALDKDAPVPYADVGNRHELPEHVYFRYSGQVVLMRLCINP